MKNKIMLSIYQELSRAKEKHNWDNLDIFQRTAIMMCEAGEALQVANKIRFENKFTIDDLRTELIQTASTCIRILEGIYER
jgi:hypothetical protein